MNAEIISVGTELILGQIADTNAVCIARRLAECGFNVLYKTAVGDDIDALGAALRIATERAELIIVTGGLGPTEDDITRQAVAAVLGVELSLNEDAFRHMQELFLLRHLEIPPTNKIQAMIPSGGTIIPNKIGTASGFAVTFRRAEIICLPGVPVEMKQMLEEWVIPHILKKSGLVQTKAIRYVHTFGMSESMVDEKIKGLMGRENNPRAGTMVGEGVVSICLCADAESRAKALELLDEAEREVRRLLGEVVFGIDGEGLEHAVAYLLKRGDKTIATAESCTGGLVSDLLTNVPGVSDCFVEGIVAYSNKVKVEILGVPEGLIYTVGAVSPEVACAMAGGVRRRANVDIGLGITGIAGPTGATPDKPAGLVYIAFETDSDVICKERRFLGERVNVKRQAALEALNMVRLYLLSMGNASS
jgi:nicotinamide-nucleotide amidase